MEIEGKAAIVTGGGTGVGRTAAECSKLGVMAMPFEATVEQFGRLDILVQSAGTTVFVPHANLDAVSAEDWQHIMAVSERVPLGRPSEPEDVAAAATGPSGRSTSLRRCASAAAWADAAVRCAPAGAAA